VERYRPRERGWEQAVEPGPAPRGCQQSGPRIAPQQWPTSSVITTSRVCPIDALLQGRAVDVAASALGGRAAFDPQDDCRKTQLCAATQIARLPGCK